MSLSKVRFPFPYYNYPYTTKEKCCYYSNKFFCGCMEFIGVGICARFLWKQPYLTEKQIVEKNSKDLKDLVKTSGEKRFWHFGGILANLGILVPTVYAAMAYEYLPEKYYSYVLGGVGTLLVGNIYGMLAHTYNSLRFGRQINIINHGVRIARSIRAMNHDLLNLKVDPEMVDQEQIKTLLYQDIIKHKTTWNMITYPITNSEEETCSPYQTFNMFVVRNMYYENLFFIFDTERTANDFMSELNKLNWTNVDYLYNNPDQAKELRKTFIAQRMSSHLIYNYYLHNQ